MCNCTCNAIHVTVCLPKSRTPPRVASSRHYPTRAQIGHTITKKKQRPQKQNRCINKGVSGRLRHPLFGRGLRRWYCERLLAGAPPESIKYESPIPGWIAEASPDPAHVAPGSRQGPTAASRARGGSSSNSALGPNAAKRNTEAARYTREKYRERCSCATLPLGSCLEALAEKEHGTGHKNYRNLPESITEVVKMQNLDLRYR